MAARPDPLRRARRVFVLVLVVGVVASGILSSAVAATASPGAGLTVLLSGSALLVCLVVAGRMLAAFERLRARGSAAGGRVPTRRSR